MTHYVYQPGSSPLLISMPHNGTAIPDSISQRMTERALRLPDTDWHVARLYEFGPELGASVLSPVHSRYVIDPNRPPDGRELYPGASNTELCPLTCFDGSPVYRPGQGPDKDEIRERTERYWRPYHDKLEEVLRSLRERHGRALLYEAHSIRSEVPRFFSGTLPDLNLGTADGTSCAAGIQRRLVEVLEGAQPFSHAVNGRFKGGYITRSFGDPRGRIHAVQLELSQATYMEQDHPFRYVEAKAAIIVPVLRTLVEALLSESPD